MAAKSKIIVMGATGTAGFEAARVACAHPDVAHVTILARRRPNFEHSKLEVRGRARPALTGQVIEQADLSQFPPALVDKLRDHRGVIYDLGMSSNGVDEADYRHVTEQFALSAAQSFSSFGSPEQPFVRCTCRSALMSRPSPS